MPRRTLTLAAALAMTTLAACGAADDQTPSATPPAATTPSAAPVSDAKVNEQDQVSESHKKREAAAMDDRPLLDHLPMTVGTVTLRVEGLAADGRQTIIGIVPGDRTDEQAQEVYRAALTAFGDSGKAYDVRVIR